MKISAFFQQTLGANLANTRWSWGAIRSDTNRVFLRVWEDERRTVGGIERIMILSLRSGVSSRPGGRERRRHVELLREGAEGFGVVCTARFDEHGERQSIDKYDDQVLLKFGALIDQLGNVYAEIVDYVSVAELAHSASSDSSLAPDIQHLSRLKIETTTKQALIDARIGQGQFRANVLRLWNGHCCVTGSTLRDAIRASHIKPWRESNNSERLDPHNGLPLIATLDSLFDAGLISFAENGAMLVSRRIDDVERRLLGLTGLRMVRRPQAEIERYLRLHRETHFTNK